MRGAAGWITACSRIGFETSAAVLRTELPTRSLLENQVRNIINDDALPRAACAGRHSQGARNEVTMATKQQGHIVETTSTEARQGEPGPSVLALLTISTGLAILVLAIVWFVFFRT
jgi:hypothetical protein